MAALLVSGRLGEPVEESVDDGACLEQIAQSAERRRGPIQAERRDTLQLPPNPARSDLCGGRLAMTARIRSLQGHARLGLTLARNHHALPCGRADETRSDHEDLRVADIFVGYTVAITNG
jgi:hypothetical protein